MRLGILDERLFTGKHFPKLAESVFHGTRRMKTGCCFQNAEEFALSGAMLLKRGHLLDKV